MQMVQFSLVHVWLMGMDSFSSIGLMIIYGLGVKLLAVINNFAMKKKSFCVLFVGK